MNEERKRIEVQCAGDVLSSMKILITAVSLASAHILEAKWNGIEKLRRKGIGAKS
jgi:hypothetical protein